MGVGTVLREARPFDEAELVVDGARRKMTDLDLVGAYHHRHQPEDGQDRREWVVPVEWQVTVPREDAFWKTGMFANQNSACKLRARFTIDEVSRRFRIDD
ncbi:hypothetical protein ACSNOI_15430 [Actinomadura kijaniata]|uniref:hypothetical protein n=1 Tax=Actinomadura kijaniata TaxID=46161 RepID=UPI003F1CDEAB